MRRLGIQAVACGVALVLAGGMPAARAGGAPHRPVVAELFTSEGCSSCPPADALLSEVARTRPDVLALAFHVTYWDKLGWPDPFALPDATERQRAYRHSLGLDALYTPQLVVDGTRDVLGSDHDAVRAALAAAAGEAGAAVAIQLSRFGGTVRVAVGAGQGRAMLLLLGYDAAHRTPVARGENAGQVLTESNVVRELRPLGRWDGAAQQFDVAPPRGEHFAALLQSPDGRFLGAAMVQ
jgi:hypothetical protein